MAFGFLNRNADTPQQKNCISIPENMYDAPFEQIIACMDPHYLEDTVICYFDKLLPYRKACEYKYFKLYSSWEKLFNERFYAIIDCFSTFDDFKTIIETFPECSYDVYDYLLRRYIDFSWRIIADDDSIDFMNAISLVEDILIPMADFETYQSIITKADSSKFSIIRKRAFDIVESAKDYAEMWDILQVLEQYFDIPRENFSSYITGELKTIIGGFCCGCIDDEEAKVECSIYNFDIYDYNLLKEIFMDTDAYNMFMDYVPLILSYSGLEFYTILIRVLGPVHEVIYHHDWCAEFLTQEEKRYIDDFYDQYEEEESESYPFDTFYL